MLIFKLFISPCILLSRKNHSGSVPYLCDCYMGPAKELVISNNLLRI